MVEEAPVIAASAIVAIILVLHLSLLLHCRFASGGHLSSQEAALVRQIKELHRTANGLASPDTFAKAAKLKRSAAVKEKELAELRQKLAPQKAWMLSISFLAPYVLKAVIHLILTSWFWNTPVAIIPVSFLQPFGHLVGKGIKDSSGEVVLVGIIPWLVLSSGVSSFVAHKVLGKVK